MGSQCRHLPLLPEFHDGLRLLSGERFHRTVARLVGDDLVGAVECSQIVLGAVLLILLHLLG